MFDLANVQAAIETANGLTITIVSWTRYNVPGKAPRFMHRKSTTMGSPKIVTINTCQQLLGKR